MTDTVLATLHVYYHQQATGAVSCVDQEFFVGKIFHWLNFRLALFWSLWPLYNINLLRLYVGKYFICLIFCHWRWSMENFSEKKFPIYGIVEWSAHNSHQNVDRIVYHSICWETYCTCTFGSSSVRVCITGLLPMAGSWLLILVKLT